ncbi:MAG: type II toxin-antitoxin system RelE/ParE family toxin [Acidimicrobiales bacterium]
MKPAALRPLAEADLVERTRHYRGAGGSELGTRFFDGAIAALRAIEGTPGIGSPRIGELIGVPEVRRIGVDGFPCGWLYIERPHVLDVVRLLADRQDVAVLLDMDLEQGSG